MISNAEVKFNKKNIKKLKQSPDLIMFGVARMALDASFPKIPKNTGDTRSTSLSAGVRKGKNGYYIGSYTEYADDVYTLEDRRSNINWSEPGTGSYWFDKTWKSKGTSITKEAVKKYGIK